MDTSEKYIKMCGKTEEIQELWNPQRGDFYSSMREKEGLLTQAHLDLVEFIPFGGIKRIKHDMIWLPRQDQLQEIVIKKDLEDYGASAELAHRFSRWVEKNCNIKHWNNSMEQLWLAFIMEEKYEKIWDSKEWVKEKKHSN